MNIIRAYRTHRENLIHLLQMENLPVSDLPDELEHFFVAIDNSEVVGAIGLEHYHAYGLLRSMVVRKDHRNAQIAAALIDKLEQHARALKITQIFLLTETASEYFKKKEYQEIDRSQIPEEVKQSAEFASVCSTSALTMTKTM